MPRSGSSGGERQVRQASAEIEWGLLCTLARQAPVAGDLRLVTGLLHVNDHLERMGGLCANVAKTVPGLANRPPPTEVLATLNEMGAHVRRVVTASLACLADGDAGAAERLPTIDQAVDRLNDRVFAQMQASNDPTALGRPPLVLLARSWSASATRRSTSANRSASSSPARSASCSAQGSQSPCQRPVGSPPQHPPRAPTDPDRSRCGTTRGPQHAAGRQADRRTPGPGPPAATSDQ